MAEDEVSLTSSSTHAAVDGKVVRRRKRTWRQRLVTLASVTAVCYTTLVMTLACVYYYLEEEEHRATVDPPGLAFLPPLSHADDDSGKDKAGASAAAALHIFYHVFLPDTPTLYADGLAVVDEQMEQIMHNLQAQAARQSIHLHYTLIGAAFPTPDYLEERYCQGHHVQCSRSARLASGNEEHTLQALYDHCHNDTTTTNSLVAYLHSKGTFHPTPRNTNFRRALTDAALHVDCLSLVRVDQCNVCGLQFVPFPIRK
jgi:hypothetical protein